MLPFIIEQNFCLINYFDIYQITFFFPIFPMHTILQLHNDVTIVADEAALSKIS